MSVRFSSLCCVAAACVLSTPRYSLADDAVTGIVVTPANASGESRQAENLPLIVPAPTSERRAAESSTEPAASAEEKPPTQPASASESASSRAREEWQKQLAAARQQNTATPSKNAKQRKKKPASRNRRSADSRQPSATQSPTALPVVVPSAVRLPRYSDIYRTIPFSRAEYDFDPGYRHNATMELLLNQLRPEGTRVEPHIQVIVQPLDALRTSNLSRSGYRAWSKYPWH